jgi:hypothetical protein
MDAKEIAKPQYCVAPSCNASVHFHYPFLYLGSLQCDCMCSCSADRFVSYKMGGGGSAVWKRFKKHGMVHFYAVNVHGGSGGIASRCGLVTPICME